MKAKTLKAVIVDDEEESLHLLQNLIQASGLAQVTGFSTDPSIAVTLVLELKPDILFLDITMPGKNGFEVLDDLRKIRTVNPYVVFTTAYDEFAVKAFEYAAFDYVLKPVEQHRLTETILRCIDTSDSGHKQKTDLLLSSYRKLMFRNISGILFIEPTEIIYIQAEGNYSSIYMANNRTETVTMLLGKVEDQLPSGNFYRISRSNIINLKYLKKLNTRQLKCVMGANGNEFKCSISRDRIGSLVERMKNI